jgi:ATP-dependent DNA helicase DinG
MSIQGVKKATWWLRSNRRRKNVSFITERGYDGVMKPVRAAQKTQKITLPEIPALSLNARQVFVMSADGELQTLSHERAETLLHKQSVLLCHAPYIRGRLDKAEFYAFDVLELFAFVHPGKFCVPTPHGLCKTLGIKEPESFEDTPLALIDITRALLSDLKNDLHAAKADPLKIAEVMGLNGKGWGWTPYIFAALGQTYEPSIPINSKTALSVWKNLPEWAEDAPEPPPSHHGVSEEETRERLNKLLGFESEKREAQAQYAVEISKAFMPPSLEREDIIPHIILAEAGTGIGKTLGYLAPASVWAEKNQGSVWISTYTKNLQRQIGQELDRLYPDPVLKETFVATRKGRENYLCLLNLEEAAMGAALAKDYRQAVAAGIMSRWAAATKDGDLTGPDYPGWLSSILGYAHTLGLSDRRGECIFGACDHYTRCFVEHSIRKAKRARIVVANHAVVMIQAALAQPGQDLPTRYIFDEGHHLFDAADGAFAAHLSGTETRDLRRWILGPEGGRRGSRARGLKKRAEDLSEGDQAAEEALRKILNAAECLTADNWTRRLKDGAPSGPCELFLAEVYAQAYARADGRDGPYSLETEVYPASDALLARAATLKKELSALQKPMQELVKIFRKKLAEDEGLLAADTRKRLESVAWSIERRAVLEVGAWVRMLESLERHSVGASEGRLHERDPEKTAALLPISLDPRRLNPATQDRGHDDSKFIDWIAIERMDGKAHDIGLYRHYIDPMQPFAASIKPHLHGMAVTSATLRDDGEAWSAAHMMSGADYLSAASHDVSFASPFDYKTRTKVFIINDVRKDDLAQVAGAYKTLFEASGGGALGLFTAISRLRAVHDKIAAPLEERGIPLYSQHVDEIDTGTLVDMFRENEHSCLLGTDAMRDGVDVPGDSLRLMVFDRVPWPRPTILHKARRDYFADVLGGKKIYDEMITRLKLKQAFGRLIRRAEDKGVFVMLDPMLPSRLHSAFPEGVEIVKCGLSEAVRETQVFLCSRSHPHPPLPSPLRGRDEKG